MTSVNGNIRPDQVIAKNSRGDAFACFPHDLPSGAVIVACGPDSRILWAKLWALGVLAAEMIRETACQQ